MSEEKPIIVSRVILRRKTVSVEFHWDENKLFKIYSPISGDLFKQIEAAIWSIQNKTIPGPILLDGEAYALTGSTDASVQE